MIKFPPPPKVKEPKKTVHISVSINAPQGVDVKTTTLGERIAEDNPVMNMRRNLAASGWVNEAYPENNPQVSLPHQPRAQMFVPRARAYAHAHAQSGKRRRIS